ncbi:hypothetical protein [Micrococcus sp. IITD107]|uniref:hypothetical protein n=1 Tax=Micrococcus sp. IITD107 TaxID=3342790 RepID=UPI0035B8F28C
MTPSPRRLLLTVPAGILFGVLMSLASGNWGMVGVGLVMGVGTGLAWSATARQPDSSTADRSAPAVPTHPSDPPPRPTSSATGDSMES